MSFRDKGYGVTRLCRSALSGSALSALLISYKSPYGLLNTHLILIFHFHAFSVVLPGKKLCLLEVHQRFGKLRRLMA